MIKTVEKNGRRIRYEFRHDCALVIFVDFQTQVMRLADMLERECMSVNYVRQVTRYDDYLSSIVVKLNCGYIESDAVEELQYVFDQFMSR